MKLAEELVGEAPFERRRRRQLHQKRAEFVAKAAHFIGETIQQREAGETESLVIRQLREGLSQTPNLISTEFLLAYEPVWAIGTGLTASAADASAIHTVLRAELRDMIGTRADAIPILYGGSVNAGNAADLLAADEIDGLLVGGASVEASSWLTIAQAG